MFQYIPRIVFLTNAWIKLCFFLVKTLQKLAVSALDIIDSGGHMAKNAGCVVSVQIQDIIIS